MKKSAGLIGFLLFFLLLPSRMLFCQQLQYKQFTVNDGLASNTVYASLQDRHGDIWFATEFGLSRFNGFTFENYQLREGLPDLDVLKIFQDSRGRIWFALSNGELCILENGKIQNSGNNKLLRSLKVNSFHNGFLEENNGGIWITTHRDGIFFVSNENKIKKLKPLTDLPGAYVAAGIWQSNDGQIRVCTQKGIVNLSENPGLIEIPISSVSDEIRYSKTLRNNRILLGINQELIECQLPTGEIRRIGTEQGYKDRMVTNIAENAEGHLWISSINGLHFFRKGILQKESHSVFFQGKTISGILFDRQGNLWLSTLNEGVFLVQNTEVFSYEKTSGIPDVLVTALQMGNSRIYWGNDRGQAGCIQNGKVKEFKLPHHTNPYGRGRVREFQLRHAREDEVWAASENGFLIIREDSLSGFFPSPSKSILFKDQYLYMGNSASCLQTETEKLLPKAEAILWNMRQNVPDKEKIRENFLKGWKTMKALIPETRVYKLATDANGNIWIATQSGLFSLQYGQVIYHEETAPDLGLPFQTLAVLGNGCIAAGSNGRGVLFLDRKGKISWLNESKGLSSNIIRNLRPKGKDSLWICTSRGINLISGGSSEKLTKPVNWTRNNSILSDDDVFDLIFHKDTLWLACGKKIECIPADRFLRRPSIRFPETEYIELNGQRLTGIGTEFPFSGKASIKLKLRNTDFRNIGKVSFQYRLLPDTNWKELTGKEILCRFTEFNHYVLELRNTGPDSRPMSIRLLEFRQSNYLPKLSFSAITKKLSFLLFTFLLLMVSLAYFLFFSESWKNKRMVTRRLTEEMERHHIELIRNEKQEIDAMNALLQLRKNLTNTPICITLNEELNLCRKYLVFLSLLHPQLGCSIELSVSGQMEKLNLKEHLILEFLIRRLKNSTMGSFRLLVQWSDEDLRLSLISQEKETPQTFWPETEEIFLHSPILKLKNRFILPLQQLFLQRILHRRPPSPRF